MPQMSRFFAVFCVAAALAAVSAAPAAAEPMAPSVTVQKADLDLSQPRDAHMMLRRIEAAADNVCGASVAREYQHTRATYERCRDRTISHALARLGAPLVDTLYAQETPARDVMLVRR